jgi:outer membrane protein OmpA-like peptidoglycan-associated protein
VRYAVEPHGFDPVGAGRSNELNGGLRMNAASGGIAALAVATMACVAAARTTSDADLRPQDAVDLILTAFEHYPLLALSDGAGHGQLETRDFFIRLIRDRRFPHTVRNIVIEFGNARYQSVMDRYVSGEAVTRDELRHVWEDTTQVTGVWSLPMYERMLAEVRAVNRALSPALRIRVLLGDPPIDWSTVTNPADEDMNDWRDAHFAHVIEREVMKRTENALLFFGGAHLGRKVMFPNSLIHLLDARYPGQTCVIAAVDAGRTDPRITKRLQGWTVPAGASVRGTWLGKMDVQDIGFGFSRGMVEDDIDVVLLLSSAPPRQDEPPALTSTYGRELARRRALHQATLPFRGAKIRFEESRAAFAADAEEPLQAVLMEVVRDRGLRLLVKAFADSTEPNAVALSTWRAELLVDWLVARGIRRDRLVPRGCGALRPLTFGKTAADRAMNRRAELVRLTPTAGCEPPW